MKNLPKVFANPINREFRNNKDIFVGSLMAKKKESEKNIFKKEVINLHIIQNMNTA